MNTILFPFPSVDNFTVNNLLQQNLWFNNLPSGYRLIGQTPPHWQEPSALTDLFKQKLASSTFPKLIICYSINETDTWELNRFLQRF